MKVTQYGRCLRCGRQLKSEKCKKLGYGETCYKKLLTSSLKKYTFVDESLHNKKDNV